jgi:lipopolysaccharide transport system permease protein
MPADSTLSSRAPARQPVDTSRVVIEASRKWTGLGLREVWKYRELLVFLTWRDIQLRYRQTLLGAAWAVIQPLFLMLVFTLFFGRLAGMPSDGIPYPLFAYAGLLPWTFVSNAAANSGNSLVGSAHLVTKVYFPRLIIPGAAVLAGLVDYAIAAVLFFALLAYGHVALTWQVLALVPLALLATLLALAVGLWMSALNVKYRDVRHALPFLIQLWMFATPIIYPVSLVPARWRWATMFNPMAGIVEGHRSALLGRPFDPTLLAGSAAVTLILLAGAALVFRRMEKSFADVI